MLRNGFLLHQGNVDRGRSHKEGRAKAVDGPQQIAGGVARYGNGRRAHGGGQHDISHQPENMEKRHDGQENMAILVPDVENGKELRQLRRQARMGQHGALGFSRRAARVLQQGYFRMRIARRRAVAFAAGAEVPPAYDLRAPGNGGRVPVSPALERIKPAERRPQRVAHAGNDDTFQTQRRPQRFDMLPEDVQRDQDAHARIPEVARQLGFPIEGIGHDGRCARLHHAPEGNDGLRQIRQHERHTIAGPDAVSAQGRGEAFRAFAQDGVGHARVLEAYGFAVGGRVGGFVEDGGQAARTQGQIRGGASLKLGAPCFGAGHACPVGRFRPTP